MCGELASHKGTVPVLKAGHQDLTLYGTHMYLVCVLHVWVVLHLHLPIASVCAMHMYFHLHTFPSSCLQCWGWKHVYSKAREQ